MTIEGGCLCGKVRYRVDGPLSGVDHCHCSMCRRQHGAAYATYAQFEAGDFEWTAGAELVKVFETAQGAGWCFCAECGSTMAGSDNGKITSITLGTVEGEPGIVPELHIFAGSKAPWHEINDALPQFDEWPPTSWQPPSKRG